MQGMKSVWSRRDTDSDPGTGEWPLWSSNQRNKNSDLWYLP